MVGNYGVAEERSESERPHAKAALMRSLGGHEWAAWLSEHGLVGLDEIDTRALVLRLREGGAMRAAAVASEADLPLTDALEQVRRRFSDVELVAGNVATADWT
jgi:carbamoyl-phosphate synthase small subunit